MTDSFAARLPWSTGIFTTSLTLFLAATAFAQSFTGTYQGDGLTLSLQPVARQSNSYRGTISLGAQKFAAKGRAKGNVIAGSFQSNGHNFAFTLRRSGNRLLLATGGTSYRLQSQQRTANPLAKRHQAQNPLTKVPVPLNEKDKSGYLGLATEIDDEGQMRVFAVIPNGPASLVGLRRGDVIRSLNGELVTNEDQMLSAMRGPVGSRVPMVIARETEVGGTQMFNVTLIRTLMPTAGAKAIRVQTATRAQTKPKATPSKATGRKSTSPPTPAAQGGNWGAPLQVGMRIVYNAGDAVVQGAASRLVPDSNGGWRDERGNRWRNDQLQSSGGVGYTVLDIVQTAPNFVAADTRNYLIGFNNATSSGNGGVVTGNKTALGDAWLKYWISPARLAAMKNGRSGGHQVNRIRYALGGRNYNAISISDTSATAYANEIYDLKTGLLLSSSRSNRGANQQTLSRDNRITTGAGAIVMSHLRLAGTRKRQIPWGNAPAPQWVKAGLRMNYNGQVQNVMYNSGLPPLPPMGAAFSCVVNRVIGGCALANTTARYDNGAGIPPTEVQSARVFSTMGLGGLWIPPSALKKLRPGQSIDRDAFTRYQVTYGGIQNGVALFSEQGPSDQFLYAYNPQNGMLVGFDIITRQNNMGEQRRQFRLAGGAE